MKHGRKFFLSTVFMVQGWVILGMSFYLVLNDKTIGEWVQLVTIWLPMAAAVTGAFIGGNSYTTGKAIEEGVAPPPPERG